MACGRPVAITANPGLEEYLDDGRSALLVAPGDDAALQEAITSLLDAPEDAFAFGRAGRVAVEQRFTTDHLAAGVARPLHGAGR